MIVAPASIGIASAAVAFRPTLMVKPKTVGVAAAAVGLSATYNPNDVALLVDKRLNRLQAAMPIVDREGRPDRQFQQGYQSNVEQIEAAIRSLAAGQIDLRNIVDILLATQQAAADANKNASAALEQAQQTERVQTDLTRVRDSYSDPGAIVASTDSGVSTVSVVAHNRNYIDPVETVALPAGTAGPAAPGQEVFVYYDDPEMDGQGIAYALTEQEGASVATLANPYRHQVGRVTTPTASGQSSEGDVRDPSWRFPKRSPNEIIE